MTFTPEDPDILYNQALALKESGKLPEAIAAYQQTLELGISDPHEVHLNIAVIYSELRQQDKAIEELNKALKFNPLYVDARFNLATLLEELGDKAAALQHYQVILNQQPNHVEVLSRMIYAHTITDMQSPLCARLYNLLEEHKVKQNLSQLEVEAASFALGKAYDDCSEYRKALAFYKLANQLSQKRLPAYDKQEYERQIQFICKDQNQRWLESHTTECLDSPLFVCGMFRSGTTLIEQIVASHSAVTSGGELSLLQLLTVRTGVTFENQTGLSKEHVQQLSDSYLQGVHAMFPVAQKVTDKRPDNFMYLGLLKAMYPEARFICTDRNPLDVCLSVYFQQLGKQLPYASDLLSIAHYYVQYQKLLQHYQQLFPANIMVVDYDELVVNPEPVCRQLIEFCGLDWEPQCLKFYETDNVVKTASVWQVRKALYTSSSQRWHNYASELEEVRAYLEREAGLIFK